MATSARPIQMAMMTAAAPRLACSGAEVAVGAMLGEDGGRDEAHGEQYAERHEDEIVEVAEHRNEIRNEIDRRQRVGGDGERHRLGVPRHARIARRQVERMHVALDVARPAAQALHHGWISRRCRHGEARLRSDGLAQAALGMNFKATPFMQ